MNIELITEPVTLPACHPIASYDDLTNEDWLALRTKGLGGSDMPGVMEMSKYSSPLSIVMEKTGRIPAKDISEKEAVKMGNILEPLIRGHIVAPFIEELLGLKVEVIDPTHMYQSNEYPWMLINVDGFLRVPDVDFNEPDFAPELKMKLVGLEIKTGSSYVLKDWKDDQTPQPYYVQVQYYMAGTGLDEFWIVGLIGNQRQLRIVKRDEDFIANLIEEGGKLWKIIEENNPLNFPLPNGSDIDMECVMFNGLPQIEETADISDETEDALKYLELGLLMSDMKEEREKAKQRILMKMGKCKYGETDHYKIGYSRFETKRIDGARLRKERPEIAEEFTNISESGRFTIKERR